MAAPPPPHQQQGPGQQGQNAGVRHNPGPPQLTPEDQRVLRECNSESFWYRSLPVASVLSATAHILVKQGIMKPNLRYGTAPKAMLGAIIGYFIGKFSYAETCADKFLVQAPRSKIAEVVRVRRGLPPLEIDPTEEQGEQYSLGMPTTAPETALQDGAAVAQAATNPNYDQMRKMNRESLDKTVVSQEVPVVSSSTTNSSYDEMRKMNRQPPTQYRTPPPSIQTGDPNLPPSSIYNPPPPPPPSSVAPPPPLYNPPSGSRSKNKYGDEGFE